MADMPALETPTLIGPEVTLRPLSVADVAALTAAAAESCEHYQLSTVPDGADAMGAYVEKLLRQRDAGDRLPFVSLWRNRVVGSTSFIEPLVWAWPAGSARQRTDRSGGRRGDD